MAMTMAVKIFGVADGLRPSAMMLAKALGISPETVKLHRKHSYKKLDISTQSELFYLFIDSLMSARKYSAVLAGASKNAEPSS